MQVLKRTNQRSRYSGPTGDRRRQTLTYTAMDGGSETVASKSSWMWFLGIAVLGFTAFRCFKISTLAVSLVLTTTPVILYHIYIYTPIAHFMHLKKHIRMVVLPAFEKVSPAIN